MNTDERTNITEDSIDDASDGADLEMVADEENDLGAVRAKLGALKDELVTCGKERKEYLEGWQRARADYLNNKNEEIKRLDEADVRISARIVYAFLPVLDSFEQGFAAGRSSGFEQGVAAIHSQLVDSLKNQGLEQMVVNPGDEFRPDAHEAIGEVESNIAPGSIGAVLQKGYTLNGRVLRPARVSLSKTKGQ